MHMTMDIVSIVTLINVAPRLSWPSNLFYSVTWARKLVVILVIDVIATISILWRVMRDNLRDSMFLSLLLLSSCSNLAAM